MVSKNQQDNRKLVMQAAKKGMKPSVIMRTYGLKQSFVYKWSKRNNSLDKPRTGRKPVLTRGMKLMISRSGGKRGKSLRRMSLNIQKKTGKTVSHTTVRNYRHSKGFKAKKVPSKPALTKKNISDRYRFTGEFYHFDFAYSYFSDESSFSVTMPVNQRNDYTWVKEGQSVPSRTTVKHPKKVHAFGIIGLKGGKGVKSEIFLFEENMDSDLNVEIYKKCLVPFVNTTYGGVNGRSIGKYFTDGDPKHRSNKVLTYCQKIGLKYYCPRKWPGNSPDFNPTEKAWRHMKQYLSTIVTPTVRSLKIRMREAWNRIESYQIQSWFKEMKKRLVEVHDAKGEWPSTWKF